MKSPKYLIVFSLMCFSPIAVSEGVDIRVHEESHPNVPFPNGDSVVSLNITCDKGETVTGVVARADYHGVIPSNVVIHGTSTHGKSATMEMRRVITQSEVQNLINGGSVNAIDTNVVLRATCARGVNVKMYGATGDGVTDDTASIQTAILETPEDGKLYFPPGNYVISDTLTIYKRMHITGSGAGSQIFQSAKNKNLFWVYLARNMRIENLFLGSASTSANTALIHLSHASFSLIRNIIMRGGYFGIFVDGTLASTFENIRTDTNLATPFFAHADTSNNQTWVMTKPRNYPGGGSISSNANVFYNPILEGGNRCMYHSDGSGQGNMTIIGGVIEACATEGLIVERTGAPVSIIGTHFEANGTDIVVETSAGVRFSGILSTGQINIEGNSNDIVFDTSSLNFLHIGPNVVRTRLSNTRTDAGPPAGGPYLVDESGDTMYMHAASHNGAATRNFSTLGIGTDRPHLQIEPKAKLEVDGDVFATGTITP